MSIKLSLDLDLIKKMYFEEKLSAKKIADKLGASEGTINKRIKFMGLTKRSLSESHRKFNENIFEIIDSQEKAYWLGYIFADGNISILNSTVNSTPYQRHVCSLTSIDKEVIDNFIKFAEANFTNNKYTSMTNFGECEYYNTTLTSEKIFNDLLDKNCTVHKTDNLHPPTNIPQELISHFIRGYFDGDGSVYTSGKRIHVNIVANKEFCEWMRKTIFNLNDKYIYKENRTLHNDIYYFRFDTKKVFAFYNYIYKDATVFLSRKKNKFDVYIQEESSETTNGCPKWVMV